MNLLVALAVLAREPTPSPVLIAAWCIINALIGVGIIFQVWSTYRKDRRSRHWQMTSGTILASSVAVERNEDGLMYKPEIVYRYEANGASHTADMWRFGVDASARAKAQSERTVAEYPVGRTVIVYFNPDKPREAVLEPGKSKIQWGLLLFGVLVFAFCIYLLSARFR